MIRPQDATLAGYVWLPRLIDKAHAKQAGELGDLVHPCPVDRACLDRLGLDADELAALVVRAPDDDAVLTALRARGVPSPAEAWFDVAALERALTA